MNLTALLTELEHHGIRPVLRDGAVKLVGSRSAFTPELVEQARARKPALLAHLRVEQEGQTADEAIVLLQRLKTFTLPAGRMPAARAIADRLRPLLAAPELDPAAAFTALTVVEAELTVLGGAPDPELADAIGLVSRAFPGAKLIEVCKLQ